LKVLSCSLGRVGAIKRVFGGHHVVLIRDPVEQWLSARSQRLQHGNSYFELGYLMILALASRLSVAEGPGEHYAGPTATGAPRRA
jgi:hypothetical protein